MVKEIPCSVCGSVFQPKTSNHCYCSTACSKAGNKAKNKAWFSLKYSTDSEFRERHKLKSVTIQLPKKRIERSLRTRLCNYCQTEFKPEGRFNSKYCSTTCRRLFGNRRAKGYKSSEQGKASQRKRQKIRTHQSPEFKIKRMVSSRVYTAIHSKGFIKGGSVFSFLPYSPSQLKAHIESFFNNSNGFTWENHGGKWHLDHVIPHSYFHYTNMDCKAFRDCWALSNLMPTCSAFNQSKHNRFIGSKTSSGQLVFLAS